MRNVNEVYVLVVTCNRLRISITNPDLLVLTEACADFSNLHRAEKHEWLTEAAVLYAPALSPAWPPFAAPPCAAWPPWFACAAAWPWPWAWASA
jgi:hypothetical protein